MGSEKEVSSAGGGVRWDHPANPSVLIVDRERAVIKVDPQLRKVAIVGFASSTRDLAPFDDPAWEVWGVNQLYRHIPRATRWFEIHRNWNEHVVEGTDHLGWLRAAPIPTYMVEPVPEIPNSVRYPLEAVCAEFSRYFTSTIAYMIALAILEDFGEIGIYGVDMIVGGEYGDQKACCEWLMGIAHGRGKVVTLPKHSALCRAHHLYGYEQEPDWGPMKLSVVQARFNDLIGQHKALLQKLCWYDGRINELDRLKDRLAEADFAKLREDLLQDKGEVLKDFHVVAGATNEADRWREFLQLHLRGGTLVAE